MEKHVTYHVMSKQSYPSIGAIKRNLLLPFSPTFLIPIPYPLIMATINYILFVLHTNKRKWEHTYFIHKNT